MAFLLLHNYTDFIRIPVTDDMQVKITDSNQVTDQTVLM